jgi:hypothetical protein
MTNLIKVKVINQKALEKEIVQFRDDAKEY